MEWNQDFAQKLFVFSFQWQRETIYDAAKNFQKFAYAVKMFGFIDEPKKNYFLLNYRYRYTFYGKIDKIWLIFQKIKFF